MELSTIDRFAEWIAAHPWIAGGLIFLIAFSDAIILLGVLVPALPLLFAVGTLVGLGHIDGLYAVLCAALGAFAGDGLSFWLGHRFGPQLRQRWPFARYPQWLERGEVMFQRHGAKAILIARYVGAVRPFVPAIAGMLKVRLSRYVPASAFAALAWSVTFLAPGWLFGASLDLIAAVAGRLVLLLGLLLAVLFVLWVVVLFLWRWLAPRTNELGARLLAWSQRHPVLGRYAGALVDPSRPESPSLLLLALLLLVVVWAFASLLIALTAAGMPLAMDLYVYRVMLALRHPLADSAMALAAVLGDWLVLLPASLLVFAWLLWRRRVAAWHWAAAIGFGLATAVLLGYTLHLPRPPNAADLGGFGFPAMPITLVTVVFGFFAVLIARELPGRRRVWPYVLAALLVGLIGFARLYLAANWLSDVLGGALFGLTWVALLGIAYRRRFNRSFWIRPVVMIFFGALLASAWLYGPGRVEATLARFDLHQPAQDVDPETWWASTGPGPLPAWRNEIRGHATWPLNLQYVGDWQVLAQALAPAGWEPAEPAGWRDFLTALDDDVTPESLRILPASHYGHSQEVMLVRVAEPAPAATPTVGQRRHVLRLWTSPYRIAGDGRMIWTGNLQTLEFNRAYGMFSFWRLLPDDGGAMAALMDASGRLAENGIQVRHHQGGELDVVRLQHAPAAVGDEP